jgi:hypothetical protein
LRKLALSTLCLASFTGSGCQDDFAAVSSAAVVAHPRNASAVRPDAWAARSAAILSNGKIMLGVNPEGHLIVPGEVLSSGRLGAVDIGLRYLDAGGVQWESLATGCLCEGWGVADAASGVEGHASVDWDGVHNLALVRFESDAAAGTALSVVRVGDALEVAHAFRPAPENDHLYEIAVTITNIGDAPVGDLRYTRGMDWDVPPNTFSEYVTIQGTAGSAAVLHASDDSFASVDPLAPYSSVRFSGDAIDQGPGDHGAHFDFGFGALAPGASHRFRLFYGAAPSEAEALAALTAVSAEVYSLGQSNWDGSTDPTDPMGAPEGAHGKSTGRPITFAFGYAPVAPAAALGADTHAGPEGLGRIESGAGLSFYLGALGSGRDMNAHQAPHWPCRIATRDGWDVLRPLAPGQRRHVPTHWRCQLDWETASSLEAGRVHGYWVLHGPDEVLPGCTNARARAATAAQRATAWRYGVEQAEALIAQAERYRTLVGGNTLFASIEGAAGWLSCADSGPLSGTCGAAGELNQLVLSAFLQTVRDAGFVPGVHAGTSSWLASFDPVFVPADDSGARIDFVLWTAACGASCALTSDPAAARAASQCALDGVLGGARAAIWQYVASDDCPRAAPVSLDLTAQEPGQGFAPVPAEVTFRPCSADPEGDRTCESR